MKIGYYPGEVGDDPVDASVHKWIEKLKKKQPELYSLTMKVLRKMEKSASLQPFIDQEIIKPLRSPLFEIRIPKKRAGGVVRLYFCYVPGKEGCIQILEHEIKRGRQSADQNVINSAMRRYKELFK